jgi:hypothetical protein
MNEVMSGYPTWKEVLLCCASSITVCIAVTWALVGRIAGQVDAFLKTQTAATESAAFQRGEAKARMDALTDKLEDVAENVKSLLDRKNPR